MAKTPTTSMRLDLDLVRELDARGEERTAIVHRDLDRYYESLLRARLRLREILNPAEVGLVVDNLNGVSSEPASLITLTWANVEDGIRLDGLDKKWKVNGPELVEKLRGLSFTETCALVDAVERFWQRVSNGHEVDAREALNEVPEPDNDFGLPNVVD